MSGLKLGTVEEYERATEEIYRRDYGDLASLRSGQTELLTFRVGDALHALPLAAVVEVVKPPAISVVPFTPPWVEGVMWLRGAVVPVFRVSRLLGRPDSPDAPSRRILIAPRPTGDRGTGGPPDGRPTGGRSPTEAGPARSHAVGLLVDEVLEVVGVPQEELGPRPAGASDWIVAEARKADRRYAILDEVRLAGALPPLDRPGGRG